MKELRAIIPPTFLHGDRAPWLQCASRHALPYAFKTKLLYFVRKKVSAFALPLGATGFTNPFKKITIPEQLLFDALAQIVFAKKIGEKLAKQTCHIYTHTISTITHIGI